MKKVTHTLILNKSSDLIKMTMPDKEQFIKKIAHIFGKIITESGDLFKIEVTKFKESKSNPQLGYLHAEILPKCAMAYNLLGWKVSNENQAKTLLKQHTEYFDSITNEETGETINDLKSFAKASKEEMIAIIDFAIVEICGTAGVYVQSPEEYINITSK